LTQLDEHAPEAFGVEEGDPRSMCTGPRLRVDQSDAGSFAAGEGGAKIIDLEADVVQSRAPRVEELGHGVIGAQRLEQLERDGAQAHEHDAQAAVVEHFFAGALSAECRDQDIHQRVRFPHGDRDVRQRANGTARS
jgi:hypothetical protein